MNILLQIIGYFFAEFLSFILTTSVGGVILWSLDGFKKPLKDFIDPSDNKVALVGVGFWIMAALAIALYLKVR